MNSNTCKWFDGHKRFILRLTESSIQLASLQVPRSKHLLEYFDDDLYDPVPVPSHDVENVPLMAPCHNVPNIPFLRDTIAATCYHIYSFTCLLSVLKHVTIRN